METPRKFGLLGHKISHSFSKKYFEAKFEELGLKNHSYEVFDLENLAEVRPVLEKQYFRGFNVTIPFKEKIIPFLDELSEEAQTVGAVNTIQIRNGKKTGFNTDIFGFEKSLCALKKKKHSSALILGDGGAAKAVKFVLNKHKIPFRTVSRQGQLTFENLSEGLVSQSLLIIQCTPVGTFPHVEDCLQFPFSALTPDHFVMDLIYNPSRTRFLQKAAAHGAATSNGRYMLEQQAEKSWDIWNY